MSEKEKGKDEKRWKVRRWEESREEMKGEGEGTYVCCRSKRNLACLLCMCLSISLLCSHLELILEAAISCMKGRTIWRATKPATYTALCICTTVYTCSSRVIHTCTCVHALLCTT